MDTRLASSRSSRVIDNRTAGYSMVRVTWRGGGPAPIKPPSGWRIESTDLAKGEMVMVRKKKGSR